MPRLCGVRRTPDIEVHRLQDLNARVSSGIPVLQALAMVAETDLVAAMPRHIVMRHAARYRVVVAEPPIPLSSSPVLAIAPRVATMDGGLSWLLGLLERSAKASLR